jgi:hypothetical protein
MTTLDFLNARSVRVALGVLLLALAGVAWTFARAMRTVAVPVTPPPHFATGDALAVPERGEAINVSATVELNLFSDSRSAPPRRYRLAGYAEEAKAAPPTPPTVLGTAVSTPERSFAICRIGESPARIVRVGEQIGGFTVRSIERSRVVFTTPTGEQVAIAATGTQS